MFQISHKLYKFGTFSDHIASKNVLKNLIRKNPGSVQYGDNLSHFGSKSDKPGLKALGKKGAAEGGREGMGKGTMT